MPRYIEKDALVKDLQRYAADEWNKAAAPASWSDAYESFIDYVSDVPTADVEPIRHGRWIRVIGEDYECSNCKAALWAREVYPVSKYKYCWSCGAKMDGGEK